MNALIGIALGIIAFVAYLAAGAVIVVTIERMLSHIFADYDSITEEIEDSDGMKVLFFLAALLWPLMVIAFLIFLFGYFVIFQLLSTIAHYANR